MDNKEISFREKLDKQHHFPGPYLFKFIVPKNQKELVTQFLPDGKTRFKESSNGKYVSVTVDAFMESSDKVIDVYKRVATVEGVISL